jgi:lactam utilization protein B
LKLIQKISVDTLCLHGDNVHADQNAKLLQETLLKNGVEIAGLK